jgi:hypothetical protein
MSNSTSIPSFASEALRRAVAEARPTLESVEESRNKVSEDIKELEAYLDSLQVRVTFRHPLGKWFVAQDEQSEQYIDAALEDSGSASGEIHEDALLWGEDKAGRFRLLYELCRWNGDVEVDAPGGPFFWDESTLQRGVKPLIETKWEVRKRMYQHLPDFVRTLSEHLAVGPRPVTTETEDIPF